jgi:putative acyl-CoA dehydrogenase
MNWTTHHVSNQFDELTDYNLHATDQPLRDALEQARTQAFSTHLDDYGRRLGQAHTFELADLANRHTPELQAFDARGRRIDQVHFHPSWHALMALHRAHGLVSMPFASATPGRWSAWAASLFMATQVEAGTMCPITMTQAAIPLLAREPELAALTRDRLLSPEHDARDVPMADKRSIWVGMGMTEKQGGSDVRANETAATPIGGSDREYSLRGHKWFFSAPMSDAHLVVAKTPDGAPTCFFVPRWQPDGRKNPIEVQRLKAKVGNRSNASSEVEFKDAYGLRMGEPGRGIPTIIEMATYTRLNCVIGSAALVRQGLVQALAYTRERKAFGKRLIEQPLMRSVLADLALENEANVVLMMRLAQAYERDHDPLEQAWKRLMTPAAKFWVCKRAVELTGETMEVFGGNGYVDEGIMARLFREAPVNSIWEGSGNVMCLDVMRAISKDPVSALALLGSLSGAASAHPMGAVALQSLEALVASDPADLQALSRLFAQRLVTVAQAALLMRHAPSWVAEAFIATRLTPHWGAVVGCIDTRQVDVDRLLQRAFPA